MLCPACYFPFSPDVMWYDNDMIWYDVILYDMILCDVIWYDMTWYYVIWYNMIWYENDMIRYDTIRNDMMWYDMIWYDMVWYDVIWYDMIWYDIWYDLFSFSLIISLCLVFRIAAIFSGVEWIQSTSPSAMVDSRTINSAISLVAATFGYQTIEFQEKAITFFSQTLLPYSAKQQRWLSINLSINQSINSNELLQYHMTTVSLSLSFPSQLCHLFIYL